jgi:hypothetical protein
MSVKFILEDDPQEYTLAFDFNELSEAEMVGEMNLLAAIAKWPALSCREMRCLLYALLKPAHPAVLLKEAGDLLTRDMTAVYTAVKQVLFESDVLTEDTAAPAPAPAAPEA